MFDSRGTGSLVSLTGWDKRTHTDSQTDNTDKTDRSWDLPHTWAHGTRSLEYWQDWPCYKMYMRLQA